MNFYYKIKVGDYIVNYVASAESEDHKADTYDGSGETGAISTINSIMHDSKSMTDFVAKIKSHGATSMMEEDSPVAAPASSGMTWGSNSSDEDDE